MISLDTAHWRSYSWRSWVSGTPGDHHVGVLGTLELRPDSRAAQEDNLEPEVLDPAQVGDDSRHRHQG